MVPSTRDELDDFLELSNCLIALMSLLCPLFPIEVFANEASNLSSTVIIELVRAGRFGRTLKIVSLLRIRSAKTRSLLQLAAAETVFVGGANAGCVGEVDTDNVEVVVLAVALAFILWCELGFAPG